MNLLNKMSLEWISTTLYESWISIDNKNSQSLSLCEYLPYFLAFSLFIKSSLILFIADTVLVCH